MQIYELVIEGQEVMSLGASGTGNFCEFQAWKLKCFESLHRQAVELTLTRPPTLFAIAH
jgi:hypothetical protein